MLKSKMASSRNKLFSVEEVLEAVFSSDNEEEGEIVEEDQADRQEEILDEFLGGFDGGEQCDNEFFRENARMSLLPLVRQAFLRTSTEKKGKLYLFCLIFI